MRRTKGFHYVAFAFALAIAVSAPCGCGTAASRPVPTPGVAAVTESAGRDGPGARVDTAEVLGLQDGFQQGSYAGRFVCQKRKLDVGLYRSDTHNAGANAQQITDREDSAALMPYGDGAVISDHDFQGFAGLLDAAPGDEATLLLDGGVSVRLVCVSAQDARKTMDILLDDGRALMDAIGRQQVAAYTCTGEPGTVRVTIWDAYSNGVAGKETGNA